MNYTKTTLSSGLTIITAPRKETSAATILVLAKVGSRNETNNTAGISHFIEHMMFKGTERRPNTIDISKELDGVGAEFNAFTGKDFTGYYVKIDSKKLPLAFDVLSDMLLYSKLDPKEISREKKVITEEINMYRDNPLMYIESMFEELLYQEKDALGRQIVGTKKTVKAITRERMLTYLEKHYTSKNMVLAVAGNIKEREVEALTKKYFPFARSNQKNPRPKEKPIAKNGPRVKLMFKETEQVHLCLGVPSFSYFAKQADAVKLLAVILGGNMSSRLFIQIREKLGLCYSIQANLNFYEDSGNFVIQAGLDKKRIDQAIRAILKELERIKTEGVTDKELKAAKDFIAGKLTLSLEDSESIANWVARQWLLESKLESPDQVMRRIRKVSLGEIKKVAQKLFNQQSLNLALIGPYQGSARFLRVLKNTSL